MVFVPFWFFFSSSRIMKEEERRRDKNKKMFYSFYVQDQTVYEPVALVPELDSHRFLVHGK